MPAAPTLTRPEGPAPVDFHLSRRGLAGLFATGYAAYALSAEAEPITTDAKGLVIDAAFAGADRLPLYIARPEGRGRYPVVLVVNEVFGVHEYIKDICRRFAKLGYVAIAPQFFFRADAANALATTTDFKEIQRIVATAHNTQVMGDVGATLEWAAGQPFVDRKRMAITGFCWGGAVVWMACAQFPQLKAGVAWYGRLAPPKPTEFMGEDVRPWPLQVAGKLTAPVLGLYGALDKGIPQDTVEAMRTALAAAHKEGSTLTVYPDAQHGFHADYRPTYNEADARDGWTKLLAHFRANHAAPGAARGLFG